jgi:hypothetical protein
VTFVTSDIGGWAGLTPDRDPAQVGESSKRVGSGGVELSSVELSSEAGAPPTASGRSPPEGRGVTVATGFASVTNGIDDAVLVAFVSVALASDDAVLVAFVSAALASAACASATIGGTFVAFVVVFFGI